MLELLYQTGPIGYAILGCAVLTVFFDFIFAALAAMGVRVPAPLWFFGPALCQLLGTIGCAYGLYLTQSAVAVASPDMVRPLAAMGWSSALLCMVLAFSCVAVLLFIHAWLAAVGHAVRVGAFPEWGVGRAVLAVFVPGFLGFIQLIYVLVAHDGLGPLVGPPVLLMFGAPALGLICLRTATDLDSGATGRLAAARFSVGVAWTGAIIAAAVAANIAGEAQAYQAVAQASAEMVAPLVAMGEAQRSAAWGVGLFSFAVAAPFAVSAGMAKMEDLDGRAGVIGAVITGVMAVGLMSTHVGVVAYSRSVLELVGPLVQSAPM